MGQINGKEVKENILKFLNEHGPSLPVAVAKRVSLNSIFASAFLSELSAEGLVKISDMKVGGSPLYYTPATYEKLENWTNSLNQKEREACNLLKQAGILQDSLQHPAIRVALRGLKDFAIPFKQNEQVLWRYFLFSEEEVRKRLEGKPQEIKEEIKPEPAKIEIITPQVKPEIIPQIKIESNETIINPTQVISPSKEIIETPSQEISEQALPAENITLKKEKPRLEKFLDEVKSHLVSKNIEILKIDFFDKKNVIGKIKINEAPCLFFALDKKRIDEKEMIKAWKKAASQNLPYYIFTREDHSKKLNEIISAAKGMLGSDKIASFVA